METLKEGPKVGHSEDRRVGPKVDHSEDQRVALRDLLEFQLAPTPVPLDQVESVESICTRFCTGGMSLGALSREAHEVLALSLIHI